MRDWEDNRKKITEVLNEAGRHYKEKGLAETEIHQEHDVHAFYRLCKAPDRVIHVQGYPGMSSEQKMRVWARMMDYDKMMEIRGQGGVSVGNEHRAVIQFFENFQRGVEISYRPHILEKMLAENVPELRI